MQNVTDIKRHIKSIKDIEQITKALKLISIAKMRESNKQYLNNVRYFSKVRQTMKNILVHKGDINHKYLQPRADKRTVFIVIAGDTGMAGEYNNRILTYALKKITDFKEEKYVYTIGRMATDYFVKNGIMPKKEFINYIQPSLENAELIMTHLLDRYHKNEIDEIKILFTYHLENKVNKAHMLRLLPILSEDFTDVKVITSDYKSILDFEPSAKEVFNILIPQYILGLIYSCIIQSLKCEHEERMEAMHSATTNAKEMLEGLELQYHRARQEQITTELTEMASESTRHS